MGERPDHAKRVDEMARRLQRAGGKMTVALTVPILLGFFLGWIGLAVGVAIAVAVLAGGRGQE